MTFSTISTSRRPSSGSASGTGLKLPPYQRPLQMQIMVWAALDGLAAVERDAVVLTDAAEEVVDRGENVGPLAGHEREALVAGDVRADAGVEADGENVQRVHAVAADEIETGLLRVEQPVKVGERGGFGEDLDRVVAGAAGKMCHCGIGKAAAPLTTSFSVPSPPQA